MRKTVCTVLIAIIILIQSSLPFTVFAEDFYGTYAYIVTDDCAFYSDASLKILKFYLPETYCVKIVSAGGECSRVVYMDGNYFYPATEGYVKNVCLKFCTEIPEVIYPSVNLIVISDEVIFSDSTLTMPKAVIPSGTNAVYYGSTTIGANVYLYVYTSGFIGYMRKDAFAPFSVPLQNISDNQPQNSDSVNDSTEQTFSGSKDNVKNNFSPSEILIIAVIIIIGLSLMFLIIRPERPKKDSKNIDFGDD